MKSNNQKFTLIGLLFITIFSVPYFFVGAITLDKTYYYPDEQIITVGGGGPLALYNLDTGEAILEVPAYDSDWNLNYFGISVGNYSIIELASNIGCFSTNLSYGDCLASPEFVNEFRFSVLETGSSAPNRDSDSGTSIVRYTSYPPDATIISPVKGVKFSRNGIIEYKAHDLNDDGSDYEKSVAGLIPKPVSLFYTDKIADYFGGVIDPSVKNPIVKDLLATGKYNWSIKDLVPGVLYRIIIDAMDLENTLGENVSDFFSVDFTAPNFKVSTDVPAVRSGDVKISVDSSEDLVAPPEVRVVQNGMVIGATTGPSAKLLVMKGEASHYEGTYTVLAGYDGTARIYVSGTDGAGNVGTTTVSGGTFSVGVNPPPKPRISAPANKAIVPGPTINLSGTTREDTTVVLKVNGKDVSTATPDSAGAFTFKNIALEKVKNQGINILSVSARDAIGTIGEATDVEIKYNSAPVIVLEKPINSELINDKASIVTTASDENGDTILYTYQVAPYRTGIAIGDSSWTNISDVTPVSGLTWNATEVDDGDYLLRVIADDGSAKTISKSVRVTIRNTLPFIRFENGRKTVTKESNVTIVGHALTSRNLATSPNIVSIEYSQNGGVKWTPIVFDQGYSSDRKFSLPLTNLKEGTYPILWRVKDSRDLSGTATHVIVVDRTAPKVPVISSPRDGDTLSNEKDEDTKKAGEQATILGKAEAGSTVTLSYASYANEQGKPTKMTTKALPDGQFSFNGITLSTRGKYNIDISAQDDAGNISVGAKMSLIYNNPPIITFINPKPFHGLSGVSKISWNIQDPDNDHLGNISLSYRKANGAFKSIANNVLATDTYDFDVSNLAEGNDYELRIATNDGITNITENASFSVDKTIPVIDSLIINNTASTTGNVTATGSARDNVSGIEFVEYSVKKDSMSDVADTWYRSTITKGYMTNKATYSIKQKLAIADGTYTVRARAVDSAGNISKEISQTIRIDATAPRIGAFILENSGNSFAVSLEGDTRSASIYIEGNLTASGTPEYIPLNKDIASGLWKASVSGDISTTTKVFITAIDNNGNTSTSSIDVVSAEELDSSADGITADSSIFQHVLKFIQSLWNRI